MKQRYSMLLLFVLVTVSSSLFAQANTRITNQAGLPKFEILNEFHAEAEAPVLLQEKLALSQDESFKPMKQFTDNIGFRHTKYEQVYKGVPVAFASYTIHAKNNAIKSFNGSYFDVKDVNTNPSISKKVALNMAVKHVGASKYLWENKASADLMSYAKPTGELIILPSLEAKSKIETQAKLAYRFDIYASQPTSRAIIYIDAHNGDFLYEDKIIHHIAPATGSAATRYSGTKNIQTDSYNGSYRLRDNTRGGGIETYDMNTGTTYSNAVDFTDNNNNWTAAEFDNAQKDNAALDAHYGAAMTYDYWSTKHNRNSYDGNGAKIKSYVHFDVNYDNAYWNGSVMTYGDGSGTYFDALTSLDVAAHEIGHAVMSNTADLTYSYESGALNEGFSDIWGASVEFFAAPNKQTWLIGEDIERRAGHAALRSMSDPKSEGQPDTYQGTNWATGSGDNGGVHTNSGVLNHWYYLVTKGGSGTNDNSDTYSVIGIGIDKASQVAYRMISVYLNSSSNYADARTAGIQSAVDLFGSGSAAEIAVTNAWYAVGVGAAYGNSSSYCTSKGGSTADEYISRVQLNTIDNTTGASNGYSDQTTVSTDLAIGDTYTVTVTPTWTGTTYNEAYAVWIDFNNDQDFADAGELVWSKAASKDTPNSGSFTVAAGTAAGTTRMRVSMKYNGIPTACESFQYGEVEDYTINLVAATADTEAPTAPNLSASDVGQNSVDLSWSGATDNVGVTGYELFKNGSSIGNYTGTSATASGLTPSTTYSFEVYAYDDAGNVSVASNTVSVTTQAVPSSGCANAVTSFPYGESFENTLGLWSQDNSDDFDWALRSGGTPSGSTGPSSANDGSYYIYVESSSPNYSNKTTILNSPCFDLSNESSAMMNFKYHMYGSSAMGSLALEASEDNGSTWSSIWSKSGNQGNSWKAASVDLSNFTGSVKFRFVGVTGTTWQGDMAIDAFAITSGSASNCSATTLSITFDQYPEETSWDIKDNAGNTVFAGGTYGNQADYSTLVLSNCIDNGCYTFTIHDAYGDGICCGYGNGSYTLSQNSNGAVLATGGSFNSSDSTSFCVGYGAFASTSIAKQSVHVLADVNIFPNPATDQIDVRLRDKRMTGFTIYSVMGTVMMKGDLSEKSIDISKLSQGVYFIEFASDKKAMVRRIVKN